ncbi:MAG TPA: hypothetical protein VM848_07620 [Acidimicrobiia bacterium]|nr:hypothetical protein [Acidimicrobiia bacterium]
MSASSARYRDSGPVTQGQLHSGAEEDSADADEAPEVGETYDRPRDGILAAAEDLASVMTLGELLMVLVAASGLALEVRS